MFLWSGLLLLSVEIERVAVYGYTESTFYGLLYRLDSWVAKLYDFLYFFLRTIFVDNDMVVLAVKLGFFIGGTFAELMFSDQPGI